MSDVNLDIEPFITAILSACGQIVSFLDSCNIVFLGVHFSLLDFALAVLFINFVMRVLFPETEDFDGEEE